MKRIVPLIGAVLLCAALLPGCSPAPLVLYTDLSEDTVSVLTQAFTAETGIPVTVERKSAGAIESAVGREDDPCDVVLLSSSGIEEMLAMNVDGKLTPVLTANEAGLPWGVTGDAFVGMGGETWVIVANTDLIGDNLPDSIFDLADYSPGLCGLPNPERYPTYLVGVYLGWDESLTMAFFQRMLENDVQFASSPKEAAQMVAAGQWELGITTLADARSAQEQGSPMTIVIPDQGKGELGTLVVPVTVAAINREKANKNAGKLVSWLVSADSEAALLEAGVIDAPVRDMDLDTGEVAAIRPIPVRIGEIYDSMDAVAQRLSSLVQ